MVDEWWCHQVVRVGWVVVHLPESRAVSERCQAASAVVSVLAACLLQCQMLCSTRCAATAAVALVTLHASVPSE